MSSPVESTAATNVDELVEHVEDSDIIDLSDELRDTVDVNAMTQDDEINDEGASKHKRKRKSDVWECFVDVQVKEKGKMVPMVQCIYCKQKYKAVRGGPTTTLLRHKRKCGAMKRLAGKTQGIISFESCDSATINGLIPSGVYDPLKCREIIAKMIIAHELPFTFVEYQWFTFPITTVASESAFSAGGRVLDDYRNSLSKDMVEILVCGSDWIKATSKTTIQTLQQSAKEEENLDIQIPMSND